MTWLDDVEDFGLTIERLKVEKHNDLVVQALCALGNAIENLEGRAHVHNTRTKPKAAIKLDAFNDFWSAYPKKRNKGTARKAWKRIKPSGGLVAVMLNAIANQKRSKQWTKEDGDFIPLPASWLNAEGWLNETEVEKLPSKDSINPRNQWRDPATNKIWTRIDLEDLALEKQRCELDEGRSLNEAQEFLLERARTDCLEWDWSL